MMCDIIEIDWKYELNNLGTFDKNSMFLKEHFCVRVEDT